MNSLSLGVIGVFGLLGTAQAVLQPPVNGQVYDGTLGISWLQDANMVKTMCDPPVDPLWTSFDLSTITDDPSTPHTEQASGLDKPTICAQLGSLNWYEAEAWIAHLNANNYLGINSWRQPKVEPPDATYAFSNNGTTAGGFGATGSGYDTATPIGGWGPAGDGDGIWSEMGWMYYHNLGNLGNCTPNDASPTSCAGQSGSGLASTTTPDGVQIHNLQPNWYSSGTEYAPDPSHAWDFFAPFGLQVYDGPKAFSRFVWPVHPGQSAAPTTTSIPALPVWGLGLMVLLVVGLARRRLR